MPPTTNLPKIDLAKTPIDEEALRMIPPAVRQKYRVVAFELKDKKLKLAVADPSRLRPDVRGALEEFSKRRGLALELFAADPQALEAVIEGKLPLTPKLQFEAQTPYIDLTRQVIPLEILERFPKEIAEKYGMVVYGGDEKTIKVAALSPRDPKVQEILRFIKEKNDIAIDLAQTDRESLNSALGQYEGILPGKISGQRQAMVPAPYRQNQSPAPSLEESGKQGAKKSQPEKQPLPDEQTQQAKEPVTTHPASEPKATKEVGQKTALPVPSKEERERFLNEFIGRQVTTVEDLEAIVKKGQVPLIVAAMIALAAAMRASDIHLEAMEKQFRVRYRIDGILRTIILMPLSLHPPITSRIKILAEMKIDEQRIPQDGRYDVIVGDKQIDLRVSTLPTVHGEKIAIRLLDKSGGVLTLAKLGLMGKAYETLIREVHKPYGVILSTGPTGSGKSTTLYAILHEIATPQVNVITLEDPVEYEIAGINQSQVKPTIGFSFAEGLRSILRQDPNIIMVGETRDAETASMVTHAALTGHLVLSTLHTNDAAGALPRLINMGVEPFLITSAMNCVIGQRLVRKICPHCREEVQVPMELKERIVKEIEQSLALREAIGTVPIQFFKGKSCSQCTQGYQGRIGVYEVLAMSEAIETLALKNAPASAIAEQARKEGMLTMFQDGIVKVLQGITTLDEVFRVTAVG